MEILSKTDTRAKLIDSVLYEIEWAEASFMAKKIDRIASEILKSAEVLYVA